MLSYLRERDGLVNVGRTIFAQLMGFIAPHDFRACVDRYEGPSKINTFSFWGECPCLAFAYLVFLESLRDIQVCLRAAEPKLYRHGASRYTVLQVLGISLFEEILMAQTLTLSLAAALETDDGNQINIPD